MKQLPFGETGLRIAPLGLGSLPVDLGPDRLSELYGRMLDAGCNLIDTAAIYDLGEHERFLGRFLKGRREQVLLVTKCGHHDLLEDGSLRSREISMQDIDDALQRLNTDYLDAMLLHSTDLEPLQSGRHLEVLQAAKAAGKLRFIGYSGDNERADWAVREGGIDLLECSFNLVDQLNLDQGIQALRERGGAVIAKKPIASAMWNFLGRADEVHPANRDYVKRFEQLPLQPEAFACDSMGELALRFCIAHVNCAIVSSRSEQRQDENLAAAEKGPLSESDCAELRDRFRQTEAASGSSPWLGCN